MNENRRRHDEAAPNHEALASLLRDADPAAGDTGLDAVERARMRQAITVATDRHSGDGLWSAGWQAWKQPALAAAALITVVGLVLWTLDRAPESPSREVADAGVTAPEPLAELTPRAPNPEPETVPSPDATPELVTALDPASDAAAAEVEPATPPSPEPAATPVAQPENTTAAAVNDPSPPDRQARTVQFTAPRGTRIIWTLDPDFELSTAGGDARQEQRQ